MTVDSVSMHASHGRQVKKDESAEEKQARMRPLQTHFATVQAKFLADVGLAAE